MVKTFDPKNVAVIVGGSILTGFADGTWITCERRADAFSLKVGVTGEGARCKSNDKSGKITLHLMQTSSSNDTLSGFAAADELSNAGAVPFFLKDNSGRTLATALTSWVKKLAPVEMGKEPQMWTWEIETDDLELFVGGN